jgi:hypothetical protein
VNAYSRRAALRRERLENISERSLPQGTKAGRKVGDWFFPELLILYSEYNRTNDNCCDNVFDYRNEIKYKLHKKFLQQTQER